MYINNKILQQRPIAVAMIEGSDKYNQLRGTIELLGVSGGTIVSAKIYGLPDNGFYSMHIHNGKGCSSKDGNAFSEAGSHLNLDSTQHPFHTGDMPPLLSNAGFAWLAFFTNRFTPKQVLGYPVIIHKNPDDFTTQPSGNAGEKIACGIIRNIY